ncbi:hypothetical protein B0T16DRAFT_418421 [Cercophora newfieldiana]|uniref:Uncharacterized protein n=1 Tax=Cercophora newfieldiana TaxID=92897 RepID=A0AA40CJJ4_9PEZI|nr:hypothetical protein B0T16DRAFT_418421 [Cercophora newfieldiana]
MKFTTALLFVLPSFSFAAPHQLETRQTISVSIEEINRFANELGNAQAIINQVGSTVANGAGIFNALAAGQAFSVQVAAVNEGLTKAGGAIGAMQSALQSASSTFQGAEEAAEQRWG